MSTRFTDDESVALQTFATLGISVQEFLVRMQARIVVTEFRPGHREITVAALLGNSVKVTRDDIRWVIQRYLRGKTSGEELSNWAGLLLAISAYELPSSETDDDVLALLSDLALPLKNEYLDREVLRHRLRVMKSNAMKTLNDHARRS